MEIEKKIEIIFQLLFERQVFYNSVTNNKNYSLIKCTTLR